MPEEHDSIFAFQLTTSQGGRHFFENGFAQDTYFNSRPRKEVDDCNVFNAL